MTLREGPHTPLLCVGARYAERSDTETLDPWP